MGLVALPNLYCSAGDVADYLSQEGVDMRLDDHSQASGQTVIVRTNGNQGDVSLAVTAIGPPLPNGCILTFDGAGIAAALQVIMSAAANEGDTTLAVMPLLAALPQGAQAVDQGVNAATFARVLKARQYATTAIQRYCLSRYNDSDLARCWSVNQWATVIAARWICKRRAQGCPSGIESDYDEIMRDGGELQKVKRRQIDLENIPTRTSSWPAWSNVTIDRTYNMHPVRVEKSVSEPTVTQYGQLQDWMDLTNPEW